MSFRIGFAMLSAWSVNLTMFVTKFSAREGQHATPDTMSSNEAGMESMTEEQYSENYLGDTAKMVS
jgi:hypothetical protein